MARRRAGKLMQPSFRTIPRLQLYTITFAGDGAVNMRIMQGAFPCNWTFPALDKPSRHYKTFNGSKHRSCFEAVVQAGFWNLQ